MAIARELARLMNGAVRLESGPEGTVVTLELPSAERLEPARAPARPFSRENDADGE